jgi:CDP-diacylglycerol--serine O-phosphatidyltransferase
MWRFVVPSLLTCASITLAFFGIAEAVSRRFDSSAWLILLCVLLDKADGTAARLLKASTRFGVELDSLSDLIAFGLAPAVLVLSVLAEPPPGGLVAAIPFYGYLVYASCALYVVAAALRLAKYNIVTEEYGHHHFFGIPTTAVGALVCCFYLTVRKYELSPVCIQALPLVMVFFALLMVSRIPIRKIGVRKSLPSNIFLFANVFFVYLFGILRVFPEYLLGAGLLYTVGGSIWATAAGVRPPGVDTGSGGEASGCREP